MILNKAEMATESLPESVSINISSNSETESIFYDEDQNFDVPWVQVTIMIIVLIFGVLANVSVIYIVLKNPRLRSTPNMIVVNLTVGDLLCLVVNLPFIINFHTQIPQKWIFGQFMCKFANSAMVSSGCITVFSLMALAIERYLTIAWPWRNRDNSRCVRFSRRCCFSPTWQIIILIWVGSLIVGAPIWKTADATGGYCLYISHGERQAKVYKIFRVLVAFVIPLITIVIAHTLTAYALIKSIREPVTRTTASVCHGNRQNSRERSRIKLAVVISVLSIMFFICWLPFYLFDIWFEFFYGAIFETDTMLTYFLWKDIPIYILSCLNPIMLFILSTRFRQQLLLDCFCRKREWRPGETFSSLKSSFLTAGTFRSRSTGARRSSPAKHERVFGSSNDHNHPNTQFCLKKTDRQV